MNTVIKIFGVLICFCFCTFCLAQKSNKTIQSNTRKNVQIKKNIEKKIVQLPNDTVMYQRAKNGDANAQAIIGRYYFFGYRGVDENEQEAYRWIQKSVQKGSACGFFQLGKCYEAGVVAPKKRQKAKQLMAKAFNMLKKKRGALSPEELFVMGMCYWCGFGTPENTELSIECYKKSSDLGFDEAQFFLGDYYTTDWDLNYRKALYWFHKAAEQNNEKAQYRIGMCYYSGNGVESNKKEAIKWLRIASGNGEPTAQFWLANSLMDGIGCEKNISEAIEWYKKSAKGHIYGALYKLGCLYRDGVGVDRNYDLAIKYLKEAYEEREYDDDISGIDLAEMRSNGRAYYQKLPKRSCSDIEHEEDDPFSRLVLSSNWDELDENTRRMYQMKFKKEKIAKWGKERAYQVANHLVEIGFTAEQVRFSQGSNYEIQIVDTPYGRVKVWVYDHCSYFFVDGELIAML